MPAITATLMATLMATAATHAGAAIKQRQPAICARDDSAIVVIRVNVGQP